MLISYLLVQICWLCVAKWATTATVERDKQPINSDYYDRNFDCYAGEFKDQ